jgi:hypothetical protein
MEMGIREVEERPDVVVVHVRDHDLPHLFGLHAQQRQARFRRAQVLALALCRHLRGEAGVHHDRPLRIADQPHEIIHRHRRVVGIAADEMLGAPRIAPRVADRKNFVIG